MCQAGAGLRRSCADTDVMQDTEQNVSRQAGVAILSNHQGKLLGVNLIESTNMEGPGTVKKIFRAAARKPANKFTKIS